MSTARHRHYGMHLTIGAVLLGIVLTALPLPEAPTIILNLVVSFLILAGVIATVWHVQSSLCEKCISSMPLDAAAKAEKRRPALRVEHLLFETRRRGYLVLGLFVALSFVRLGLSATGALDVGSLGDRALQEAILLWQLVMLISQTIHRTYQPWCLWCHGGDGRRWEVAGQPDPSFPHPA